MFSRIHVDKESQLNDKLKILFNYNLLEAEYSTILPASNDNILFFA